MSDVSATIKPSIPNNGIEVLHSSFSAFDVLSSMVCSNIEAFTTENAQLITECVKNFMDAIEHVKLSTDSIVQNYNLGQPNYDEVIARRIVQQMNYWTQRYISDDMFFTVRPWNNHAWRVYVCYENSIFDLRCQLAVDCEWSDDYNGAHAIYGRLTLI